MGNETTGNFGEANLTVAKKFIKAWGYDFAKHYVAETLRVQRLYDNGSGAGVWERNLAAIESLAVSK